MKKALVIILTIILLIVFCVSAYQVGTYFLDAKRQSDIQKELSQQVEDARANAAQSRPTETEEKSDASTESTPAETTEPGMLPGYAELYEENSDMVGWLTIPGTEIDYPVMHTPDSPNFYLDRNFYKEESQRGSLYIREECDVFDPSDNVTIYGHAMKDGTMFADLHLYLEKETWDNNSLIFFDNLYEYHTYKIFSVFITTASLGQGFSYHQMEYAASEEDFDEFIATCKELALYETGITPKYGDKIICLSTCEYSQDNGRLVVAAVRIS